MRKPFFIAIFLLILIASLIIYFYSPMKIEKISIKTDKNLWNEKIIDLITSKISIGTEYNDEKSEEIENFVKSLPWVEDTKISFIKGNLDIEIREKPVKFCISTKNETLNVGHNGFILGKDRSLCKDTYFYEGKSSPVIFTENGFPKLRNNLKLEIGLLSTYLKNLNPIKENPNILLTDEGIKLLYPEKKLIIFLGNSLETWKNFNKLFTILDKPYIGFYDFRFSGILIRKGEKKQ